MRSRCKFAGSGGRRPSIVFAEYHNPAFGISMEHALARGVHVAAVASSLRRNKGEANGPLCNGFRGTLFLPLLSDGDQGGICKWNDLVAWHSQIQVRLPTLVATSRCCRLSSVQRHSRRRRPRRITRSSTISHSRPSCPISSYFGHSEDRGTYFVRKSRRPWTSLKANVPVVIPLAGFLVKRVSHLAFQILRAILVSQVNLGATRVIYH